MRGADDEMRLLRPRLIPSPRLGVLRQHVPRPLTIPASYFNVEPPAPTPTISIVTPCLHQGRFLERTLASVIGQRYPALEYVVQDGGSTDQTLDILRRFDPPVSWVSGPDRGQADAINRGFVRTSGQIMGWLNSDDLLLPGALAIVARYFSGHPDVDVVYGNRLVIDERDQKIGSWIMPRHSNRALGLADYVPQETLFWRRRAWEAVGGQVDESFRYALDWDLLLRFKAAGATIVRLPRFLGAFRVHDDQKTLVDSEIGAAESKHLLLRIHRRELSRREVLARLAPYLARHLAAHATRSVAERLPPVRHRMRTIVLDPADVRPDTVGATHTSCALSGSQLLHR
jgi:glycosyltransferase involved in cell wall biosynthesis